jgi:hypothetical protein
MISISQRQQQALNDYTGLMREIRTRLLIIESALNRKTGLPPVFVQEFCYLQLRMVCELIALGCLITAIFRKQPKWKRSGG